MISTASCDCIMRGVEGEGIGGAGSPVASDLRMVSHLPTAPLLLFSTPAHPCYLVASLTGATQARA